MILFYFIFNFFKLEVEWTWSPIFFYYSEGGIQNQEPGNISQRFYQLCHWHLHMTFNFISEKYGPITETQLHSFAYSLSDFFLMSAIFCSSQFIIIPQMLLYEHQEMQWLIFYQQVLASFYQIEIPIYLLVPDGLKGWRLFSLELHGDVYGISSRYKFKISTFFCLLIYYLRMSRYSKFQNTYTSS